MFQGSLPFCIQLYSTGDEEWGEGGNMQCKPLGKINYFILFRRIKRVLELNFEIFLCAEARCHF